MQALRCRALGSVLAGLMVLGLANPARGEVGAPAAEDAARAKWVAAFMKMGEAGRAAQAGNKTLALQLYSEARDGFQAVRRRYPEWQSAVIAYRVNFTMGRIRDLNAQLASVDTTLSKEELVQLVLGLRAQVATLEERASSAEAKLDATGSEAEGVTGSGDDEIADLRLQINQLEGEAGNRQQANHDVMEIKKIAVLLEQRLTVYGQEKEQLQEELVKLQAERQVLKEQLAAISKQLKMIEAATDALQTENEQLKSRL